MLCSVLESQWQGARGHTINLTGEYTKKPNIADETACERHVGMATLGM